MSWLAKISIANRKLAAMLTILVIGLGAYAATAVKQSLLPDLSLPTVAVNASYAGASPEVIEEQVVKPIESAVQGIDSVDTVTSTSRQGSGMVSVSFDYGVTISDKASEVQQALSKIQAQLPSGVSPQVQTGSTNSIPTMTLSASSDQSSEQLAKELRETVVPKLKQVDGVNQVTISGENQRQVVITPDSDKLAKHGLTTQSITSALNSNNSTSATGSVTSGDKSVSVQVGKALSSVQQIKDLWLSPSAGASQSGSGGAPASGQTSGSSGSAVQLKDVASVALQETTVTNLTRTDGRSSLGLSITLAQDGSATTLSDGVRGKLSDLEETIGHDAELTVISDNGPQVSNSVKGLVEEGGLGLLMAVIVIVLFLRSARSTIVTSVSIPLSLLIALIGVWMKDYSLNILTLGALTMAVGRVVDDSIVVLENIKRHLGYGEDKKHAVLTGVREVSTAITASTITTVSVFVPIALVSGLVGQFFSPFSFTVVVAMLASLLVSLTIVPVLAYWFLDTPKEAKGTDPEEFRRKAEEEERSGLLSRGYVPVIHWSIRHRKTVIAISTVVLIGTFSLLTTLKTTFLGSASESTLSITQTMPGGTNLQTTDAAAKKVEAVIADTKDVDAYQVTVGSQSDSMAALFGGTGGSDSANYTLALAEGTDVDALKDDLDAKFDKLDGVGDLTYAASGPGGSSSSIDVVLKSQDNEALRTATDRAVAALKKVDEVNDVASDLGTESPQITVKAKGEKAAKYGLTDSSLASTVSEALQGSTVAQVTADGTQHNVVLKSTSTTPDTVEELNALPVTTTQGTVRLGDVATVTRADAPVERTRVGSNPAVTVSSTPVGDDTGAASTAVEDAIKKIDLPAGVTYSMGGVTSDQSGAFSQLILAMVAAIAIVLMVLIAVFRSIRQTLVLLMSVPFSFTGAFLLLAITGMPLGVAALIGLLMLIGIVVTNAVVLVDLINQYREQGMSIQTAVEEGGRRRLRPILMTALATIFALVPMALGVTESGAFISQPLAVVVIGGLVSSTALTLVLIPTLYTMIETRRERRKARRTATPEPAPAPTPAPTPVS
ncbi:efflux RND transporter permease subunit [Streptomyces justiciae]|uniref:efflux RND transporter permease subunit n=1 Tax=Streptomyces justiciae TaxID=2780140 RepID=UPI002117DF69|nr:efflux RND transporter permease subunit [Streptomyces justiciae]MCW8379741.1 efflux RND transporter permease subunit [Streptomyces justiciae]